MDTVQGGSGFWNKRWAHSVMTSPNELVTFMGNKEKALSANSRYSRIEYTYYDLHSYLLSSDTWFANCLVLEFIHRRLSLDALLVDFP
jgi:hypothetical protein